MTDTAPQPAARIIGLDIARFCALAGMMATHLWTSEGDGSSPLLSDVLGGKAAALFAVLAGVGIALTARRYLAEGRRASARWAVFARGLVLVALGLTLGLIPGGIVIILVYYGVLFWLALPLVTAPTRVVASVAVVWAVLWPQLSWVYRATLERPQYELASAAWTDFGDPLILVRGLLITGTYPALGWVPYVLAGLVVGRAVIAARDTQALRMLAVRLVAIGGAMAVVALMVSTLLLRVFGGRLAIAEALGISPYDARLDEWIYQNGYGTIGVESPWLLAAPSPHTGTTFDLAITIGIAVAVIGATLLLGSVLGPTGRRVLSPLTAAGGAPLTVYTLHVITEAIVPPIAATVTAETTGWWDSSVQLWLLHVVGALLLGLVLTLLRSRGPLETVISWVGARAARLGGARG